MTEKPDALSHDHLQVLTRDHDVESDYGSEIDDHVLVRLLTEVEYPPARDVVLDEEVYEESLTRLAPSSSSKANSSSSGKIRVDPLEITLVTCKRDSTLSSERLRAATDVLTIKRLTASSRPATTPPSEEQHDSAAVDVASADNRSPLERFRMPPKKPLSVTDIVSPAWCELQYWYNLTKYGKVRATPAMKQGTGVHRTLEEEVYTQVRVDTTTREERFALRLWNIITGLQTLQRDGMTRELEVWGLVEGELVVGVIDEITTAPLDDAEARKSLQAGQTTMEGFLERPNHNAGKTDRTIYLTDIKTRQKKTLPPAHVNQLRPVEMQLSMYHHLFSSMASGKVPSEHVFSRYRVDPDAVFSDEFLAQMTQLHDEPTSSSESSMEAGGSIDAVLAHTTLRSLWFRMLEVFSAISPTSVSPILTAEYRSADEGTIIGSHQFSLDPKEFERYVADEMRWWRGERETKGVEVEEAYKCRICQFAPNCLWRLQKVENATQRARGRRTSKAKG